MDSSNKHVPYTDREKVLLSTLIKKYNLVESKKTNSSSLQEKRKEWEKIRIEYNAQPEVTIKRTTEQLKKLWNNLKQKTRKAHTIEKHARLQTGGGPYIEVEIEEDPVIKAVESAAPHVDVEVENAWDSTAIFEIQAVENSNITITDPIKVNTERFELLNNTPTTYPIPNTSRAIEEPAPDMTPISEKRGMKRKAPQSSTTRERVWDAVHTQIKNRNEAQEKLSSSQEELISVQLEAANVALQREVTLCKVADTQLQIEKENLQRAKVLLAIAELQKKELEK